jgi:hypothetical protein
MTERTQGGLPPVAETLGKAAHTAVVNSVRAQEGHSQSHDSDSSGTCHHYQTAAQSLRAVRSPPALEDPKPSPQPTDMRSVFVVEWSVRCGPIHSQGHSQSAAPPDPNLIARLAGVFKAAIESLPGGGPSRQPEPVVAPQRPPAKAVRATSLQSRTTIEESGHASSHSESGDGMYPSIRAQDLHRR